MILITGATGTNGREIVAQLSAKGLRARAMVRRREDVKLPQVYWNDSKVRLIDNSLIRGKFQKAIIFVKGNIRFRIFLGGAFGSQRSMKERLY
jgi:nucleoside-diphosphate-sugar epimerase